MEGDPTKKPKPYRDEAGNHGTDGWFELEFSCKPGRQSRAPCVPILVGEPWQYRMDWNIWFLGFGPESPQRVCGREHWLFSFVQRVMGAYASQDVARQGDNVAIAENKRKHQDVALALLDQSCTTDCINYYMRDPKFPKVEEIKVDMYHYWFFNPEKEIEMDDTEQCRPKPGVWDEGDYERKVREKKTNMVRAL